MQRAQRKLTTQSGRVLGTWKEMEESEKEAIREASEEVSHEFKSLINTQDLDSLKQLQLLMYILPIPLSEYSPVSRLYDIMF